MIRYSSTRQLTIEGFETPFENSLSADNRWVKFAGVVPWDKFAGMYMAKMKKDFGRPGISPRMVLGALIIKHIEKLDDRGVIQNIQENVYMQFFVGLSSFNPDPIFDPSLFVTIRKRIGAESFDALNIALIQLISEKEDAKHIKKHTNDNTSTQEPETSKGTQEQTIEKPKIPNKGKLQMDATVADQEINYPTDTNMLRNSIKQSEKLIDKLYLLQGKKGNKPRTYRRKLNKKYLAFSKKRRKSKAEIRKTNRIFLSALKRNIGHINKMLDSFSNFPLLHREQKMLWVINLVYDQQKYMFDHKVNAHPDRIVNIFQPHVRPIIRGKQNNKTEFGSKLGLSLDQELVRVNTLSWDAYNESGDLIGQVEAYYELHNYYPELVQVDKIYATRENRKYLKERGIRITAAPLGRKKKEENETSYQKRKRKKEATERNRIEGKIGQAKRGYNLNNIRARRKDTSESWIGAIIFIVNLLSIVRKVSILLNFTKYSSKIRFRILIKRFRSTIKCQMETYGLKKQNLVILDYADIA